MKKFVLESERDRDAAIAFLRILPLEHDQDVIIQDHKESRSIAANRLYWVWITTIAGETGETKEAVHKRLKKAHLVKIFERDDEGYAEMVDAIRSVYKNGMKAEAYALHDKIVELTSTTQASVHQFHEYLEDIEKECAEQQIVLPHPDDLYDEALGRSRKRPVDTK